VIIPLSAGFEIFATTADLGIRAWGPTLPVLFQEAARGLFSLLIDGGRIASREWVSVQAAGRNPETLLVAWLNELLFLFETRRFAAGAWKVSSLDEHGVVAEVGGEPLDLARHRLVGQVKAATYHELAIRQTATGWDARVVLDV